MKTIILAIVASLVVLCTPASVKGQSVVYQPTFTIITPDQFNAGTNGEQWISQVLSWGIYSIQSTSDGQIDGPALGLWDSGNPVPISIQQDSSTLTLTNGGPGFFAGAQQYVQISAVSPIAGVFVSLASVNTNLFGIYNITGVTINGTQYSLSSSLGTTINELQYGYIAFGGSVTNYSIDGNLTFAQGETSPSSSSQLTLVGVGVPAPEPNTVYCILLGLVVTMFLRIRKNCGRMQR